MRLFFLFVLCAFLGPKFSAAAEVELSFKLHGKEVKKVKLSELEKLVPSQDVKVWEPHEEREQVYRGIPLKPLLEKIYGEDWKKTEEVLFTCLDGYQPSIPVARVQKYPGYLVFRKTPEKKFDVRIKYQDTTKVVSLAPFYLIWDNIASRELKNEGMEDWPYQVNNIDLIHFAEKFPKLAPPAGSAPEVQRGFLAFRKECMVCHTVNGDGGTRAGLELNYPVNITEYFNEKWLKQWIANPASIRFSTRMPGINHKDPNWEENVTAIVAYLKVMASNKQKPVADPGH